MLGSNMSFGGRVTRLQVFIFTNPGTSPVHSREYPPHTTLADAH